jgi:ureidoglycolate lyase
VTEGLNVEPLTKAAFAPYGDVIERDGAECRSINAGTTDRLHALASVEVGSGRAIVSIFQGRRRDYPLTIAMMERHPLGSQAFVPLQVADWLVVVSDDQGLPDEKTLRCFRARGDQGVNYRAGVWHHPLLVLAPSQEFLVVDRDGPGENLEEIWFADPRLRIAAADAQMSLAKP